MTATTLTCGCTLTDELAGYTTLHPCHPDHLEWLALRAIAVSRRPLELDLDGTAHA